MLSPYPLQENDTYSYEFVTAQGIKYAIYFLDYTYMFDDYPHLADSIFMFNIDVVSGIPDETILDDKIGYTVLQVFKSFFEKIENVAVYICDSLDERHLARKRKFDMSYKKRRWADEGSYGREIQCKTEPGKKRIGIDDLMENERHGDLKRRAEDRQELRAWLAGICRGAWSGLAGWSSSLH